MIGSKWFNEPDDDRESWCFIATEQKNSKSDATLLGSPIIGWELGYGNPKKMIKIFPENGSDGKNLSKSCLSISSGVDGRI